MTRSTGSCILAAMLLVGCKSDLNQQLIERELRMQEDQIYQLQDELQDKCGRLSRAAGENASLRKQLGIVDADASLPSRITVPSVVAAPAAGGPGRPGAVPPPMLVPPAIDVPPPSTTGLPPAINVPPPAGAAPAAPRGAAADGLRFAPPDVGTGASPASPAPPFRPESVSPPAFVPPSLDGVPPLPDEPGAAGAGGPAGRQLSFEQSLADGDAIDHLVINPTRTECFDGDGDGNSDGLAIVFEPRDADGRLVSAAGDVSIVVLDPAADPAAGGPEAGCIARWDIPSQDALAHFRRTSRARGLHFTLRWPGQPPQRGHVHVLVRLTTFDGRVHETDGTVAVR
jgi:hypothetical protein